MMAYFLIYKWTIVCGAIAAAALACLGSHLAARDRSLQSLTLSQASTFGVLLGVALVGLDPIQEWMKLAVPCSGIFAAAAVFYFSEILALRRRSAKSTIFVTLFIVLLAASHWITSYFPQLESHLAQAFFGDLVTISGLELWLALAISGAALVWLQVDAKAFTRDSFDTAIFGGENFADRAVVLRFNILSLSLIATSIFALGFLFTVAMLFLPTTIYSRLRWGGAYIHFFLCSASAAIGSTLGFLLSLHWERFPTVPTIILLTLILCCLALLRLRRVRLA